MSNEERELKELEMEWWILEDHLSKLGAFDWEKKIPLWKKQNEIEIKMYYLIEEYPELEKFISIKIYNNEKNY